MKFDFKDRIVYCKDDYYSEFDNKNDYYKDDLSYYKGYLLHRENGPAIEYAGFIEEWYLNGKRHRENGPAVEWDDGDKDWYLNGVEYEEKEYWKLMNLKNKNKVLYEI
jgi:hypothetical protein